MAHGKETPRQKMIGMMYLVLTALLALNVSKDVLNAFALVDEGLTKTTYNFSSKNNRLYNDFEKAAIQNEKKAGRWKKIADDVKARSNELYNYLQTLKEDIVMKAEGKDTEAIKDGEIDLELVNDKQNMDVPSEVMIGPNQNGKANDLRAFIEEYRVFLLDLVSPKDLSLRESLERNLSTDDRKEADGQVVTWQVANFQSMPLAAAITLMSKMQADVRNSEAEILSYLFGKIDEGAFKFNKLEATIIPNSNYVIRGNEYEASVFIAARDTTQPPVIFVGQYDSVMLEDGTYDYNMKGQEGKDYTQLPIVNGKGIYEVPTSSTGFKSWGGIIQLQAPDGAFIKRPFQTQFQVAEGSFSVSPIKMNVFYRGVDNPVSVSVSGVPADKIRPDISNGNIIKRGNSWIVRPGRGTKSVISVYADIDGTRKRLGTAPFRVKNVPDPVAKVNRQKSGKIARNVLAVQGGVVAEMEDFDFDLTFKVQEFNVVVLDKGGFVRERRSKSNVFTQDQRELFGSLRRGQKVYIEDIKAVGPDGSVRDLSPIVFVID